MKRYVQTDARKAKRFLRKLKKNAGANGSGLHAAGDYIPEGRLIETTAVEDIQTLHLQMIHFVKGSGCI